MPIKLIHPNWSPTNFADPTDSPSSSPVSIKCNQAYKAFLIQVVQKKNMQDLIEFNSNFNVKVVDRAKKTGTPTKDILYFEDLLNIYEKRADDTPHEIRKTSMEAVNFAIGLDKLFMKRALKHKIPVADILITEELLPLIKTTPKEVD